MEGDAAEELPCGGDHRVVEAKVGAGSKGSFAWGGCLDDRYAFEGVGVDPVEETVES